MTVLTADEQDYKKELRQKTGMPLLWLGIASIVMLFAGLTSAVVVSMSSREWVTFDLPGIFMISTIVIVVSSFTMRGAYVAAKKNQPQFIKRGVLVTLLLGIAFAAMQFMGWKGLVDEGVFFAGASSTVSGSFMYALTGLHLAHLFGGLISLLVVYVKASRGRYDSENLLGLQMSSTYWHFLGGLWVYLYIFLNFIAL